MPEEIDTPKATASSTVPRIIKYGSRVALALIVFGVLGFLVLPPVVKSILVNQLSEVLHRPVTVEGVSINPYTLAVQVEGLAVQESGGGEAIAAFDRLEVNAEWSSLWRGGPVISELKLVGPAFRIVRLADGRFNVSDLIDEFMAKPASDDPMPAFSLNNIQISGGKVDFDDQTVGEKHLISDLDIGVPFISSLPQATEIYVEPAFSASIDGSPLLIQGKSKPFHASRESELVLDLQQVQLARYIDYLPFHLPIKVVSGALDGELKLAFQRQDDDHSTLMLSGKVAIKELLVKDRDSSPLLSLRALEVVIGSLDPLNGKFAIDLVEVDSPEIHARVSPQGTINWVDFFSKELAARGAVAPAASKNAKPAPVEWSLAEAKISGGALRWRDESHGQPFDASVDGLLVSLKKFDSQGSAPAEFDVAFRMRAAQWVTLDAFSAKGGRFDLAKRTVTIDEVASRGAKLLVRRAADGRIEFVEPPSLRAVEASQKDPAGPWKVTVARYRGEDLALSFEDRVISPAVVHTIDGLKVEAENLSTEPGTTATISTRFNVNKKGEVEVAGTFKLLPLDTDLKLAIKTLDLVPLQPYFTERLNVVLTRGQMMLNGDVRLQQLAAATAPAPEAGKLSAAFSGQLAVADFSAVDKVDSSDFLKWKSLSFGHLDLHLNPDSVSIGEVALADFFARVIISPKGKLNLLQVVRQAEAASAAGPPKSAEQPTAVVSADGKAVAPVLAGSQPPLPVKVGKITLQGGDIKFTDNFIKPNYSADLKKIGGSINGLSSAAGSVATLDLRGSYDDIAPLQVKGQINPLVATPYLDVQADVKGIEMTALSPYSGKYAGYAIDKGKLSLFVKYKIEKNQLTAENRVFLDQLTFGAAVDSPEATKLPVTLAVALLKNAKGEIDINLPVAGSLDDPEFSIGGLLGSVIGNLLVKAVTAPFALLGSIFGGGEELSTVDFDFGLAAVTPSAQGRLEALAKALLDRPALKLDIEGQADPESDPEGLKRDRLTSKLTALKAEGVNKGNGESAAADAVGISAKEYPALLERVYRAEDFAKPRNVVGMVKTLPVDEMEKLILANTVVDESDLRELADRRAKAVRDWLLAHQVPAERLFLRPVKVAKPDGKSDAPVPAGGNRVVFALE
ncbi:MAG TPA: DUF748 domain-containing protein [Accumulibacter sp.]|uniref:DUF748 domain-containing protein n=1 Tax=Accumulibacter sp. TaxID=2053492 RepID=UPI002C8E3C35|nr:DUF748 domain-containing protein [Accumulibacter sp.]HRF71557.1 DUF748 domain-containing protein [Accumulibacter sp.]